ncbi:hypothetical protein CXB51_036910 [Gossypium anomalum]|uniref:Uncharacterized protein n=1 Tax=Gossypium anomalum TaxID=47600 RepID=A0A8J5XTI0_9ROSI|nr:hypothetical protein CXB51_036910 [Gossypium anomalum]
MNLTSPSHSIILFLFFILAINSTSALTKYNVLNFGAKPNGKTDSTKAFLMAWKAACASADSTIIYVPKGRYLLGSMAFQGGCKSPQIIFRIDGTLVAPQDYRVLGKSTDWLSFEGVNGVSILGGALDAKGPSLWACKASLSNCPSGATTLSFTNSKNIRIRSLLSLNSQIIGSLAKDLKEEGVQNVTVRNTIFLGTQNGLRIKSWARPSTGFVQGVRFTDSLMRNVQNPIVIDQNYCPHNLNCPNQLNSVSVSASFTTSITLVMSLTRPSHAFILILFFMLAINATSATTKYNVFNFGAKPNGKTDSSTKAFLMAWEATCSSADSTMISIPKGRYLLGSMAFQGVNGVSILGGAPDAKGPPFWACKASHSNCPPEPRNYYISLLIFHLSSYVQGVRIIAAGHSRNTDGIHVQLSKNVNIAKCSIKIGDDCISIGPGTKNLWIELVIALVLKV